MANDDRRQPSRSPTTGRMPAEEAVTATQAVGKDPEMVELERWRVQVAASVLPRGLVGKSGGRGVAQLGVYCRDD